MQPYNPYISSLICTHFFGASYLLSGLDDTAGLAWWCCRLNGNEQVCVSERHCRASLVWGEAAATQWWRQQEGGRKEGRVAQRALIRLSFSSAVSEGGDGVDRVVSSAEVLPHHWCFHLMTIIIHILVFVLLLESVLLSQYAWKGSLNNPLNDTIVQLCWISTTVLVFQHVCLNDWVY